ncbi:MAG: hypothetical protein KHX31_03785 [Akkermansia sp.]|nr:hypothetical protein [Akkermansia sp.]
MRRTDSRLTFNIRAASATLHSGPAAQRRNFSSMRPYYHRLNVFSGAGTQKGPMLDFPAWGLQLYHDLDIFPVSTHTRELALLRWIEKVSRLGIIAIHQLASFFVYDAQDAGVFTFEVVH